MKGSRPNGRANESAARPGYHDPLAGIGGAPVGRSALTLRAVLAALGLVICVVGAIAAAAAGIGWFAIVLIVLAVVTAADLAWVLYRKGRGEPG